ncbi:MAG TPA: class I adenylate cyclase [Desulfotignum sp.]|nr:class I adenylate cyclase [Desulfotignum sp.]
MTDLSPPFDEKNYDVLWASLDEEQKRDLVTQAPGFAPSLGILPVIDAVLSYHFSLRNHAQKAMGLIQTEVLSMLNSPEKKQLHAQGQKESAMVCARIYQRLTSDKSLNESIYLFKTLVEFGDTGAFFAFSSMRNHVVSVSAVQKTMYLLTEPQRLSFVDQYLQSSPEIRLKFAAVCKKMLTSIQSREAVIDFFAGLFDRKRDADPFLNNIPETLRNPDALLKNEMQSQAPVVRINGLKALSMLQGKLPEDLLIYILENEAVRKIRETVYSLIENASMGLYPQLFDPVFRLFVKADTDEAFKAFKALIVTGKKPVYDLIGQARKYHPDIMPVFHAELVNLSRLSFFVIQDIALNKSFYQETNYDTNLACILGMVKKRPERVLRMLKVPGSMPVKKQERAMFTFMEKARSLLELEKQDISLWFESLINRLQKAPEKQKHIFSAVFQDPVKKKLEALKANIAQKTIDFQDLTIDGETLSGLRFSASVIFFNGATLKNCDLSGSHMEKAFFKQAILHNIDWSGAEIHHVNFDHAVLMHINARKTRFVNCSFQGAKLFNCNFVQADLHDAQFTGAQISKTAFTQTNLTGAVFSHARISGVSFATACLDHADFSYVQSRFSRFPSSAGSMIRCEGIAYNARRYQLTLTDLPWMEKSIAEKINLLIFCEFIHYGENKFLNQNKMSILTAFDVFKPPQADFFQLVPLLLHKNIDLPGFPPIHPKTPCGIAAYIPSGTTLQVLEKFTGIHKHRAEYVSSPCIEGVFSMGSVGSLAQTHASDIDYWVCVHEEAMNAHEHALFQQKLKMLEKLAVEKCKIQTTFFVVDIQKAKNNDFGGFTQESSGTAQSRLLKEEFYRTMIHVAGKLPLWAVLPTPISLNYYHMILNQISRLPGSHRYIDLGDIHAIPVNEYFGASIWQMFKWLKSPFKSVIKMALLEKYIYSYGHEPLLCNQYKNVWMNAGNHLKLAQNDSYIILLNNLLGYYRSAGDRKSMHLILTCFFLKLEIAKGADLDHTVFGMRRHLVTDSIIKWGWSMSRLFEIGHFKEWDYQRIHRLSASIERYMLIKYNQVKKTFESHSSGLMISDEDRRILERKVDIVFLEKPCKIKKILLISRGERLFSRLHIRYLPGHDTRVRWELFHKSVKLHQSIDESLVQTQTIEEIGAWLINNNLFTAHTVVNLVPNPTPVTHDDIQKLFNAMCVFFAPQQRQALNVSELKKKAPDITCIFISFNFYAPRHETKITDYCAVYINSWGEMFYLAGNPEQVFVSPKMAKKEILERLGLQKFPLKTQCYFSRGRAG